MNQTTSNIIISLSLAPVITTIVYLTYRESLREKTYRKFHESILTNTERRPFQHYIQLLNIGIKDTGTESRFRELYKIAWNSKFVKDNLDNPSLKHFITAILTYNTFLTATNTQTPESRLPIEEQTLQLKTICNLLKSDPKNELIRIEQNQDFTTFTILEPTQIRDRNILKEIFSVSVLNNYLTFLS